MLPGYRGQIGQKITGKRAVGKVRQMQVSKKIHY